MFQFSSRFIDEVLVPSLQIRNIGLARGHLSAMLPPPIKVMRNRPAPCLRH